MEKGISVINETNLDPAVVKTEGAGKAYQSVAQSMAIAVQDTTDYLRNITTLNTTTIAACTQLMLQEGKVNPYAEIITNSQNTLNKALKVFKKVGESSAQILKDFPCGDSNGDENAGNGDDNAGGGGGSDGDDQL